MRVYRSVRACQGKRNRASAKSLRLTLACLHQVRRQLEYSIAASKGVRLAKAPSTLEAVRDIFRTSGLLGLYTGFKLHFGEER